MMPGSFFQIGCSVKKPTRLALPETRPTRLEKAGGGVLNETQTNPES